MDNSNPFSNFSIAIFVLFLEQLDFCIPNDAYICSVSRIRRTHGFITSSYSNKRIKQSQKSLKASCYLQCTEYQCYTSYSRWKSWKRYFHKNSLPPFCFQVNFKNVNNNYYHLFLKYCSFIIHSP